MTSAEQLVGLQIDGGWTVDVALPKPGTDGATDLTGSWFSFGYVASNGAKKAFLKVVDVERALDPRLGGTLMSRLKEMTDSHSMECSLLDTCKAARLDRVVQVLGSGEIQPNSAVGRQFPIPYILFELADSDLRKTVSRANKLDDAWKLRALHNVAVGLTQLHGQDIAHQDLKPSNILLFDQARQGAKIADLGRASKKGTLASHDGGIIAGAQIYAPPEQAYGVRPVRWEDRREGCDLYHLGSLIAFIFSGTTPTSWYTQNLDSQLLPHTWGGRGLSSYDLSLPALISSFNMYVHRVKADFPEWAREDLGVLLANACTPAYEQRGDPSARMSAGSPIGIPMFVSKLDRLAQRALIESRK